MRRFSLTLSVGLLLTTLTFAPADAAECSETFRPGFAAIPDLGGGSYQGEIGGLYPSGANTIPADHLELGQKLAGEITPRAGDGQPASTGKIGLVSIGVSNTASEFNSFILTGDSARDASVVVINGAQSGEPITSWLSPTAKPWNIVENRLAAAGVTTLQVQAVWVKLPEANPTEPFPIDASTYGVELATVLRNLKSNYPNIKVAYISSRIYAGYGTGLNPEPWAFQHGFGVKWTIEAQLQGDPALNADSAQGAVVAPWIAWGPYLWANGLGPDRAVGGVGGRFDGLEWRCEDFEEDGIHPSEVGELKVAGLLLEFFHSDVTACGWYLTDPTGCGAVVPTPGLLIFTDVAGSPFVADITWLAIEGITNGCAQTLFCPNQAVTRGQMAAFLNRALGLASGPDVFTDDEGSIFEDDINAVARAGITVGCAPTLFCPDSLVIREQMAAFLNRALGLASGPDVFTDDEESIFEDDINAVARAGISAGCAPALFCPDALVTRGEMAAFLHRSLG